MLLAPADKPFDYRHLPRLSIGLALLLLCMAFLFYPGDMESETRLSDMYRQNLLATEWPLYAPFLGQTGRSTRLARLEEAYRAGDTVLLSRQLGQDRRFVESIRAGGVAFLEPEVLSRWSESRQAYDLERNRLTGQVLGLDPQRFRPITFLSYAFTDDQPYAVLATVILLILIGFAVEWSAGSGVALCAWMAGSLMGGIVYLVMHAGDVTPLTGSANAAGGLLGLAVLEFRRRNSLRLLDSVFTFTGLPLAMLIVLLAYLQFRAHGFDPYWLVAVPLSAAVGGVVGKLAHRWFNREDEEPVEPAPVIDESANEEYRKDLNQVMQKLADMQFVAAEKHIRALLEKYPGDHRLIEQLYHLVKHNPSSLEFEELAFMLLTLPNHAESNQVALRTFKDYSRRSQTFVALDDNTCLQLVMRFARIGALKEAEELFKKAQDANTSSPLLAKAAMALATAYGARQMEQRASYYEKLAKTA